MRPLAPLAVSALLVITACSGSDDDSTEGSDAAAESSIAAADDEAAEPDIADDAAPGDAAADEGGGDGGDGDGGDGGDSDGSSGESADDEGDTALGDADAASSEDDGSDDDDGGFTIDGPARVRPSCASLEPGVNEFTLDAGGFARDVRIYVPTTASSDPAPVVLNWHGLGSNGPEQALYTGYETLAEQEGFLVVHATGAAVGGANSWELAQFDTDERDDIEFAGALIDTVVANWCADEARVYSTGMSNGGLFTSELVCNLSPRIAAAASIAGTTHVDECTPERPVPYVAYHGTADNVVPFGGGEASVLLPPESVDALIGEGTPDEFAEFAIDNGCGSEPTRTEETVEVVRYDYTGCENDIPMTFYEIVDGGHTWPSTPLASEDAGLAESGTTFDVDATAGAWAFMSEHTL